MSELDTTCIYMMEAIQCYPSDIALSYLFEMELIVFESMRYFTHIKHRANEHVESNGIRNKDFYSS